MDVIFAEMKKIFRPTAIIIILALTGLHFWFFYTQSPGYFYSFKVYETCDTIAVNANIVERYGTVITPEILKDIENTICVEYKEKVNEFIADKEDLIAAGIVDYETYTEAQKKLGAGYIFMDGEEKLSPNLNDTLDDNTMREYWEDTIEYMIGIRTVIWNSQYYDKFLYFRGAVPDYITQEQAEDWAEYKKYEDEFISNCDNPQQAERYREYIYED